MGFLTSAFGGFGGSALGTAVVTLGLDGRALEAGLAKTKTEVAAATGATTKNAGLAGAAWVGFADRKSTRLNSSHIQKSRMPSSA